MVLELATVDRLVIDAGISWIIPQEIVSFEAIDGGYVVLQVFLLIIFGLLPFEVLPVDGEASARGRLESEIVGFALGCGLYYMWECLLLLRKYSALAAIRKCI